jgi:hypothetical protein
LSFGSCLASIAHTLGLNKTYIPSSHTYNELGPSGSHPLTDPLWSSEATEIVHDGAHRKRTEKTQMLIHNNVLMDNLVVCWEEPNQNCGKCGKCLRTMVTLKLLGAKSSAFPGDLRLRDVARHKISSNTYLPFFHEHLELAQKKNDRKMARALKRCLRRNYILLFLQDLDSRCLGGTLRKVFQYLKYGHLPKESKVINPSP